MYNGKPLVDNIADLQGKLTWCILLVSLVPHYLWPRSFSEEITQLQANQICP